MRRSALVIVLVLLIAACSDDSADEPLITATTATPTTAAAPATTTAPATTSATTSAPTTATTAPLPTAADSLAAFFAAAVDLDERIAAAADVFNSEWDPATATVGPATRAAIGALDAAPLRPLIPGGLSPDLEIAVLAVYADLDSRIAALDGGARYEGDSEFALLCLGIGGESADRFDDSLAAARALARLEPPPTAPADSPETGALAARLEAIRSMNWGCDSCGGVTYTDTFPVDWTAQTVLGVGFDATFNGTSWDVLIYAC